MRDPMREATELFGQFWLDFDWRVAKRVGCQPHMLGSGHPIPCWLPLPKPKKKDEGL